MWCGGKREAEQSLNATDGAVIVEFAVGVPVLIFLLFVIVELSHVLNQIVWAINSSYQLTYVLAANQKGIGEDHMRAIRAPLIFQRYRKERFPGTGLGESSLTPAEGNFGANFYDMTNKLWGLAFSSTIAPLSRVGFSMPLTSSTIMPALIVDPDFLDLQNPANPQILYDCCGVKCGGSGACAATCPYSWQPPGTPLPRKPAGCT